MRGRHDLRFAWGDSPLATEDVLTAPDVADLLGLQESTVEEYARRGLIPSFKLGKHRRFIRPRSKSGRRSAASVESVAARGVP
jgi:excisionase family DNA binding protein